MAQGERRADACGARDQGERRRFPRTRSVVERYGTGADPLTREDRAAREHGVTEREHEYGQKRHLPGGA